MSKKATSVFNYESRKDPAHPGRVLVTARAQSPARRTCLSIPESLDQRVKKSVVGFKSTAIVALAEWALMELERTGRTLEITNDE